MKYICSFFVFISLIATSQTNQELFVSLIQKLQRAQYDSCQTMFDTSVTNQINSDMLKNIWESIPKYLGEYKSYAEISTEKMDSIETVSIRCVFTKTKMDLKLSFNLQQKIIGIFFTPPKNNLVYSYPDYYKSNRFYESKTVVKSGKYELPAVLCIPNNVTNPPVVILLAGSGPNDKDESIGPNKLLKDLAVGLASNGIASIRYDKRTLAYGVEIAKEVKDLGINEEVIEDAISAVKLMKKNPATKHSKIVIVGHSLGAMCSPLIAKEVNPDGIILMAGNARSLEDLMLEQYTYLSSLDTLTKDMEKELVKLAAQTLIVKNPKALKEAKAEDLPLNLTSYYWQSLKAYDQVAVAKKLKQPILVLQGERDYQVTLKDFNIWKEALGTNPKNTFISYPALNHLFMKGDGRSVPAEYERQGNMDEKVLTDITEWIKLH